ncbi:MAG: protein-L-isoaspartate O-methyltransferase [Gammaproteobacteria bacterium]|nr:protein-L-isoaspartate O-methyltransferase [Gammaproteobacteria bacterium]
MITDSSEHARFNMVQQQIRPWEVFDQRVLDVLNTLPRDTFVPAAYRKLAYADTEIPIAENQRMMCPKLEARLLQALHIKPGDKILEVGTGSGFLTACLAKLGSQVVSLEIHPELSTTAEAALAGHGIDNVKLMTADAFAGELPDGPYDAIAITGSLPQVPDDWKRLLNSGGRLFAVCGEAPVMEAWLITRTGDDSWHSEGLLETELQPLENAPSQSRFEF